MADDYWEDVFTEGTALHMSGDKEKESIADFKRAAKLGDEPSQIYLKKKGIGW